MEYAGLRKIISGGQCGVDRGGLEAARNCGVDTGGCAPKGWRTWYGPAPELAEFGLTEHFSPLYPPRTEDNIRQSDATLIFASNANSGGTALTISLCHKRKKPVFVVKLPVKNVEAAVALATRFIVDNCASTLNIAGNRDTGTGELKNFHLNETVAIVTSILKRLEADGLLNKLDNK